MAKNELNNTPPKKRKCIKYKYKFKAEYHDKFNCITNRRSATPLHSVIHAAAMVAMTFENIVQRKSIKCYIRCYSHHSHHFLAWI